MKRLVVLFFLIAIALHAQVAVAPLQLVRQQFLSGTGVPLASGCVNFFATGTSTPQAIYADSTGTTQLANPLTLDAAGEASVWMTNTGYDIVANAGVPNTACSVALGTQLWREVNKNPFSIINGSSNYIVASGTVDPGSSTAGELAYRSDIPCFRGFTTIWDCFVELTLSQTVTNKTVDISANTLKNSTNTAGHYPRSNGTQYVDSSLLPSDAVKLYLNEGVTGTTLNFLAQIVGAPSTVNRPGIAITNGVIGICIGGCGTSGTAQIASIGLLSCSFDGATTANDYVQISSSTGGQCHDAGATFPTNGNQVLGRVLSTNGSSGTYQMDFFGFEIRSPPVAIAPINATGLGANVSSTPIITPTSNGFFRFSCYAVVTQAATVSSTLPACNVLYTDGDTNVSEPAVQVTAANTGNIVGTATTAPSNSFSFYAKSGVSISYSTTGYATSGATSMQYALHIRLEGPF